MSINPLDYPTIAYKEPPFRFNAKLCTPISEPPACIRLNFIWSDYDVSQSNSQVGVAVDLTVGNQKQPITAIRGCYIDNRGSDAAVSVFFPDTGCNISCPPFGTAWQPAITNGLNCVVLGDGFGTDDTSRTQVFLLNTPINPAFIPEIQIVYPQAVRHTPGDA